MTDELLADADHAKAIAEAAIAKAEETLRHANNTYYTLLGMYFMVTAHIIHYLVCISW